MALGYEDANDAARLACDPVHKCWWAAIPLTVRIWPRSPRCRVLKCPGSPGTVAHERGAGDCVIARHRKRLHGRARRITIDLDPTDDPTHGQQQFTFFNSHYDSYCYLPMVGFLTFNDEAEQYLVAAVLRRVMFPAPAVRSAFCAACFGVWIPRSRSALPRALDGGLRRRRFWSF